MSSILASSTFGQIVRLATGNRYLRYREEEPSFKLPASYLPKVACSSADLYSDSTDVNEQRSEAHSSPTASREAIIVSWYDEADPENPHNWPMVWRLLVNVQVGLYTIAVYMSSSIYTASEVYVSRIYGVSSTVASLGLALYILGYGIGPMFFSPLSEIPSVGRNPPYMITMLIFIILSIPTALVDNVPGLMILRFLQGFFGSPCLATGGASLADVSKPLEAPYFMYSWALFSLGAPAIGPIISGFSVPAETWRWSLWEILWFAAPVFVIMLFLPETSAPTILYKRAQRLRGLTGDTAYVSISEVERKELSIGRAVYNALIVPWKINALDPAVLFTSIYIALLYAVFYTFFEVLPIVFGTIHGMNVGQVGLTFLPVLIAVPLAGIPYFLYIHFNLNSRIRSHQPVSPESRLVPALIGSLTNCSGLFIFAWTSQKDISWVVPCLGVLLAAAGQVIVFQCVVVYLALAYPQYAASLFAGNALARSVLACAAVLWSGPLFKSLGVGRGVSLLGGLMFGCVVGIYVLYFFGRQLRARSRFAASS